MLARANLDRTRALLAEHAVAEAEYDTALAAHGQAMSAIAGLGAAIAKKTVRAPFTGRLLIRSSQTSPCRSSRSPSSKPELPCASRPMPTLE